MHHLRRALLGAALLVSSVAVAGPGAPSASEDTTGIPPHFVELVRGNYDNVQSRNNNYNMLRPALTAFEAHWTPYAKRKAEIDKGVAAAEQLEKAGKLAEAQAAIEALVPAEVKGGGASRELLETRDADLPALVVLARVASARKSPSVATVGTLIRAAAGMWTRRSVADHDTEQLRWLAHDKTADGRLRMFEGQDPAIVKIHREIQSGSSIVDGPRLATKLLAPIKPIAEVVTKQAGSQLRWPTLFDEVPALAGDFDRAWQAYSTRAQAVTAAVADAGDDRAKLLAVITTVEPTAPRGWIEPRDAELPAITALARIAKSQQDWRTFVVDVTQHIWSRRAVRDADAELTAWILRGTQTAYDPSEPTSGPLVAKARLVHLGDDGLPIVVPEGEATGPKGSWIVFQLPSANWQNKAKTLTVSGKKLAFKMVVDANDKLCKKTNRVERLEPDGTVTYEEECTYKARKDTYTLSATLSEAAPAWAAEIARAGTDPHETVFVVGKLAAAGGPRAWQLKDAQILDLRFLR